MNYQVTAKLTSAKEQSWGRKVDLHLEGTNCLHKQIQASFMFNGSAW